MAENTSTPEPETRCEPEPDAVPGRWPHAYADPADAWDDARRSTRRRAGDLRALLSKYIRRHRPPAEERETPPPEPPRRTGAYARLLPLLRLVPWALALVFTLSFVWDFEGVTLSFFGQAIPLDGLLRTLAVGGLIGFLTNWLAVAMLFHPRRPRPLFGQGLIPAQRERITYRLAKAVSDDLINEEIIKARIERSGLVARYREHALEVMHGVVEDPDFRRELKVLTADYVEDVLASDEIQRKIAAFTVERLEEHAGKGGLSALALRAYRFLDENAFQRRIDEAVRGLPEGLDDALDNMDALLDRLPSAVENHSEDLEEWATKAVLDLVENLDVQEMIQANMAQYDEGRLEEMLKKTSNEQLNYIKYLGGVLGVVGGLVIWNAPLALSALGVGGGIVYAVDAALLKTGRPTIDERRSSG